MSWTPGWDYWESYLVKEFALSHSIILRVPHVEGELLEHFHSLVFPFFVPLVIAYGLKVF